MDSKDRLFTLTGSVVGFAIICSDQLREWKCGKWVKQPERCMRLDWESRSVRRQDSRAIQRVRMTDELGRGAKQEVRGNLERGIDVHWELQTLWKG